MKKLSPIGLLLCAIIAFAPVVLWNVTFLDYIDKNGKLIPWALAPVFALWANVVFLGVYDAKLPVFINKRINPWYGWFAGLMAIEIMIVLLSNS